MIAVRADQCVLGRGQRPSARHRPGVDDRISRPGRPRLRSATPEGVEAAALVPDRTFYRKAGGDR